MRGEVTVRRLTGAIVRRRLRRHLVTIDGLQHLPTSGPFVLVPNHRSYFDHFVMELLVDAAVGRPVWFLTKKESFDAYLSRLWTRAWYGIPVDRDRPSPETLRAVQRVFAAGEVLCVYPEGTRNATDEMLPFQAGAFRFALSAGTPVIPVAMVGTETVLPKGSRRFRDDGRAHLVIGEPILPDLTAGKQRAAGELALSTRAAIVAQLEDAAKNARDAESPDLVVGAAKAVDELITAALSADGRLAASDRRRLGFVVSLLQRMERHPVHLETQRIRLRGLAIANLPPALRVPPALRMRARLDRVLARDPEPTVANYLLGRWSLAMPSALGGGRARAEAAFIVSARNAEPGDTRALAGLAELYLAAGRIDEARANLELIARAPVRSGSRGEARVDRARRQLEALEPTAEVGA
ncbi:1-acyl-sn-glycerol-3-phosphate acyltransferase [Microbacterium sp. 179-I 1D1 NHS]|uniref:lysophospholipid acyltransferase family protein n=1 Tax=Microbacterium sp. 179-I 1D1 NHS TaxID=3374298 RepID=UPI0038799460